MRVLTKLIYGTLSFTPPYNPKKGDRNPKNSSIVYEPV